VAVTGPAAGTHARPPYLQPRLLGLVVLGGAVGTTLRHHLGVAFAPEPGGWPWVTFAINVVGSFLLALLLETLIRRGPDAGSRRAVKVGLGTGVLGGFTTYSTFILEADRLVAAGQLWTAGGYAVGSVVAGVLAALGGVALARAVVPLGSVRPAVEVRA
jgi:CrcB protein